MKVEYSCKGSNFAKGSVEKVHAVEKQGEVILVPVSDNPLETLRNEFSGVDESVKQMKREALETAMGEAVDREDRKEIFD